MSINSVRLFTQPDYKLLLSIQFLPAIAKEALKTAAFVVRDIESPHPFAPNTVLKARELAEKLGDRVTHDPDCLAHDSDYLAVLKMTHELRGLIKTILSSNPNNIREFHYNPADIEQQIPVMQMKLIEFLRSPDDNGIIIRVNPPGYKQPEEGYEDQFSISFSKSYDENKGRSIVRVIINEIIDSADFEDELKFSHFSALVDRLKARSIHLHILEPDKTLAGNKLVPKDRKDVTLNLSQKLKIPASSILVADHHLHEGADRQFSTGKTINFDCENKIAIMCIDILEAFLYAPIDKPRIIHAWSPRYKQS